MRKKKRGKKLDKIISIRFSDDELKMIADAAALKGVFVSTFASNAAIKSAKRIIITNELDA